MAALGGAYIVLHTTYVRQKQRMSCDLFHCHSSLRSHGYTGLLFSRLGCIVLSHCSLMSARNVIITCTTICPQRGESFELWIPFMRSVNPEASLWKVLQEHLSSADVDINEQNDCCLQPGKAIQFVLENIFCMFWKASDNNNIFL